LELDEVFNILYKGQGNLRPCNVLITCEEDIYAASNKYFHLSGCEFAQKKFAKLQMSEGGGGERDAHF
jgi:hypothetical protein